jgi:hypothetical protein
MGESRCAQASNAWSGPSGIAGLAYQRTRRHMSTFHRLCSFKSTFWGRCGILTGRSIASFVAPYCRCSHPSCPVCECVLTHKLNRNWRVQHQMLVIWKFYLDGCSSSYRVSLCHLITSPSRHLSLVLTSSLLSSMRLNKGRFLGNRYSDVYWLPGRGIWGLNIRTQF